MNKRTGGTLELTHQESRWQCLYPKGLSPTSAQINVSSIVGGHGSLYRSSRLTDRQIVLTLAVHGDVEKNLMDLYDVMATDEEIRFYYRTKRTNVYIDGWIDNISADRDQNPVYAQFTINCPQPFFRSMNEIINDWAIREDFFEFLSEDGKVGYIQIDQEYNGTSYEGGLEISTMRFNKNAVINNNGQASIGMIVEVECLDDVESYTIRNVMDETRFFGLKYEFKQNDKFYINTNFGEEEVYLIRNGETINLINYIEPNSSWLQLKSGDNILTYDGVGSDATSVKVHYSIVYKGV